MTPTRVVVLAWGNDARGDDALGPAFLARAEALLDPPGLATTFVGDYQLQPEHAIDLDGQDLALFVDARRQARPGCTLRALAPAATATFTTHGVAPETVLQAFALTFGRAAPPAFELALGGEQFELGTPLSETARRSLDEALALFARLRERAALASWLAIAQETDVAAPA